MKKTNKLVIDVLLVQLKSMSDIAVENAVEVVKENSENSKDAKEMGVFDTLGDAADRSLLSAEAVQKKIETLIEAYEDSQ